MSDFFGISSGTSFLDSYFGTSQTTSSSSTYSLNDYNMIKNGSYGKLMKAYYKNQEASTEEEVKEAKTKLSVTKTDAADAASAASKVANLDYEKAEREDIVNALKEFAESYNALLDSAAEIDDKTALREAVWLTQITESQESLLKEIGITIGEDNKLKIDETKLTEAKLTTIQTLFDGDDRNAYINKVLDKLNSIEKASETALKKSQGTYSSTGDYKSELAGLLYDTES